jgi:hypothetical protein
LFVLIETGIKRKSSDKFKRISKIPERLKTGFVPVLLFTSHTSLLELFPNHFSEVIRKENGNKKKLKEK